MMPKQDGLLEYKEILRRIHILLAATLGLQALVLAHILLYFTTQQTYAQLIWVYAVYGLALVSYFALRIYDVLDGTKAGAIAKDAAVDFFWIFVMLECLKVADFRLWLFWLLSELLCACMLAVCWEIYVEWNEKPHIKLINRKKLCRLIAYVLLCLFVFQTIVSAV